jgi:hypothetical protein
MGNSGDTTWRWKYKSEDRWLQSRKKPTCPKILFGEDEGK